MDKRSRNKCNKRQPVDVGEDLEVEDSVVVEERLKNLLDDAEIQNGAPNLFEGPLDIPKLRRSVVSRAFRQKVSSSTPMVNRMQRDFFTDDSFNISPIDPIMDDIQSDQNKDKEIPKASKVVLSLQQVIVISNSDKTLPKEQEEEQVKGQDDTETEKTVCHSVKDLLHQHSDVSAKKSVSRSNVTLRKCLDPSKTVVDSSRNDDRTKFAHTAVQTTLGKDNSMQTEEVRIKEAMQTPNEPRPEDLHRKDDPEIRNGAASLLPEPKKVRKLRESVVMRRFRKNASASTPMVNRKQRDDFTDNCVNISPIDPITEDVQSDQNNDKKVLKDCKVVLLKLPLQQVIEISDSDESLPKEQDQEQSNEQDDTETEKTVCHSVKDALKQNSNVSAKKRFSRNNVTLRKCLEPSKTVVETPRKDDRPKFAHTAVQTTLNTDNSLQTEEVQVLEAMQTPYELRSVDLNKIEHFSDVSSVGSKNSECSEILRSLEKQLPCPVLFESLKYPDFNISFSDDEPEMVQTSDENQRPWRLQDTLDVLPRRSSCRLNFLRSSYVIELEKKRRSDLNFEFQNRPTDLKTFSISQGVNKTYKPQRYTKTKQPSVSFLSKLDKTFEAGVEEPANMEEIQTTRTNCTDGSVVSTLIPSSKAVKVARKKTFENEDIEVSKENEEPPPIETCSFYSSSPEQSFLPTSKRNTYGYKMSTNARDQSRKNLPNGTVTKNDAIDRSIKQRTQRSEVKDTTSNANAFIQFDEVPAQQQNTTMEERLSPINKKSSNVLEILKEQNTKQQKNLSKANNNITIKTTKQRKSRQKKSIKNNSASDRNSKINEVIEVMQECTSSIPDSGRKSLSKTLKPHSDNTSNKVTETQEENNNKKSSKNVSIGRTTRSSVKKTNEDNLTTNQVCSNSFRILSPVNLRVQQEKSIENGDKDFGENVKSVSLKNSSPPLKKKVNRRGQRTKAKKVIEKYNDGVSSTTGNSEDMAGVRKSTRERKPVVRNRNGVLFAINQKILRSILECSTTLNLSENANYSNTAAKRTETTKLRTNKRNTNQTKNDNSHTKRATNKSETTAFKKPKPKTSITHKRRESKTKQKSEIEYPENTKIEATTSNTPQPTDKLDMTLIQPDISGIEALANSPVNFQTPKRSVRKQLHRSSFTENTEKTNNKQVTDHFNDLESVNDNVTEAVVSPKRLRLDNKNCSPVAVNTMTNTGTRSNISTCHNNNQPNLRSMLLETVRTDVSVGAAPSKDSGRSTLSRNITLEDSTAKIGKPFTGRVAKSYKKLSKGVSSKISKVIPKSINSFNDQGVVNELNATTSAVTNVTADIHNLRSSLLSLKVRDGDQIDCLKGKDIVTIKFVQAGYQFLESSDNIVFSETLENVRDGQTIGYLKLLPNGYKSLHIARKHFLSFVVIEGDGIIQLQNKTSRIAKYSQFIVPSGIEYSITNSSQENPLILAYTKTRKNDEG